MCAVVGVSDVVMISEGRKFERKERKEERTAGVGEKKVLWALSLSSFVVVCGLDASRVFEQIPRRSGGGGREGGREWRGAITHPVLSQRGRPCAQKITYTVHTVNEYIINTYCVLYHHFRSPHRYLLRARTRGLLPSVLRDQRPTSGSSTHIRYRLRLHRQTKTLRLGVGRY